MYIEINESEFISMFQNIRPENFSIPALRALFDYLTDLERDTGEPMEFDVIALCVDWSEMDADEIRREYGHIDGISEAEDLDEMAEILNDETMVIPTNNDTLLIMGF